MTSAHASTSVLRYLVLLVLALASCATGTSTRSTSTPPNAAPGANPAASRVTGDGVESVDAVLERMTAEQLIGQRFMTFLDGHGMSPDERRLAAHGLVGGFILYPHNVVDRAQVGRLTEELQEAAFGGDPSVGLFLAVDQEGGRVAALRLPDMPRFPAAYAWGRHRDPAYVEAASYVVNRELAALGLNMNFAPVLDVYGSPDESIVGDRALAGDPELVSRLGRAYLRGARRSGVVAVPKHFPGHGSTTVDSHGRLPVVDVPAEEFRATHLLPFRDAVGHGAEAMMTAHLLLPYVDPERPVTLSEAAIEGLLRGELGFSGVVISDGVAMGAISRNYGIAEAIELSFAAGVDIILVHARYDLAELIVTTARLLREGRISRSDLEAGARRVLELKARHGLLPES